jgi:hypothetical protein
MFFLIFGLLPPDPTQGAGPLMGGFLPSYLPREDPVREGYFVPVVFTVVLFRVEPPARPCLRRCPTRDMCAPRTLEQNSLSISQNCAKLPHCSAAPCFTDLIIIPSTDSVQAQLHHILHPICRDARNLCVCRAYSTESDVVKSLPRPYYSSLCTFL